MSAIAINNLPAANLPLSGSEVVPLVQSGVTVQTAVNNIPTAAASAGSLTGTTLASNVVNSSLTSVGTIGTGIWQATAVDVSYGGTGATTTTGARTNLGLVIGTNVEAWDADLDALAALSGTGLAVRTAANTWAQRTITNTDGTIAVTNGNGVSGNPILKLHANLEDLLDVGTTSLNNGDLLFYSGGIWQNTSSNTAQYISIAPNATDTSNVGFDAQGSNTNIDITLTPKGTGNLKIGNSGSFSVNGTATITVSNLGPAGVTTATIKKWLTIKDNNGTVLYVPAWGA